MKSVLLVCALLVATSAFANNSATEYNQQRAIALVDAKLLGERDQIGLSMDRYRIVSDATTSAGNFVVVAISGPGGECLVPVSFFTDGKIQIDRVKCQPGT
jgi:hypothetical protein